MATGRNERLAEGLYDRLISAELEQALEASLAEGRIVDRTSLDPAESPGVLAGYLGDLIKERLASVADGRRIELANAVLAFIDQSVEREPDSGDFVTTEGRPMLQAVTEDSAVALHVVRRPEIALSRSDLLVNGRGEPNLIHSLVSEMESADRIRIIVSFIKWGGVTQLRRPIEAAIRRGASVQVLTTTYMGASEVRAIDALVDVGAQVKVSFDGRSTRLHAKGWLFDRHTGFHTGYIGSSNMSVAAMNDGMEWNVRLSHMETPGLLDKFRATFDAYWSDSGSGFEPYDPNERPSDRDKLRKALNINDYSQRDELLPFDVNPYPFQQTMLDDLARERETYGRTRNLVVAATGTGKTMVAAFDFRRLAAQGTWSSIPGRFPRLLFVAHRKEILTQARRVFRQVLRDSQFGGLLVDGERPNQHDHVFASIQSLSAGHRLRNLDPQHFDIVIVDEFHHADAATWTAFLDHIEPKILVGLTATPERADGGDITTWFGGHVATELRLWDALERNLLVPFHYFAVGSESMDFSKARWVGGRYVMEDVDNIITGDDVVMRWVIAEINDKVADPSAMKALVFASGVAHANFMADSLSRSGISAIALSASTPRDERVQAVRDLAQGVIQAIVTVDLFNEGVDIPEVDTVVMVRPTESGTVFLQQLGRGLRKTAEKAYLTVLDFVGLQCKQFRYDIRYRALTGLARKELSGAIDRDFPYLPAGAYIHLDEVARDIVLANIKQSLPTKTAAIAADIRGHAVQSSLSRYGLGDYLQDSGLDLPDIYGGNRTWTTLARAAGLDVPPGTADDDVLLKRVASLAHIDDRDRFEFYRRLMTDATFIDSFDAMTLREQRMALGLHFTIWHDKPVGTIQDGFRRINACASFREEVLQLWEIAEQRIPHITHASAGDAPLRVHARYSRSEMLTAIGEGTMAKSPINNREGVVHAKSIGADVFNVTWQKTEGRYSPQTMYRDYAISDRLIHWESQARDRVASDKIQRYINHAERDHRIMLFARESPDGPFGNRPYMYLGTAQFVSHEGERPVSFVWRLDTGLPADFFIASQLLAG